MSQPIAILSVYDKAGLLPFAEGLAQAGVRLLGSGGTAKAIRNANMKIECVYRLFPEEGLMKRRAMKSTTAADELLCHL